MISLARWFRQVQSLSRDGVAPCAYQHDQANDPESDGYLNESIFRYSSITSRELTEPEHVRP